MDQNIHAGMKDLRVLIVLFFAFFSRFKIFQLRDYVYTHMYVSILI